MVLGNVHVSPLWFGWLPFVALCLYVFARIPRRPSEEFGWGCHPGQCPPDIGWTLWYQDDIWHPKQGALFPQAGNGRECGWVQSMPIPTGSDTPDRASWQNLTGACGGGEAGWLLWRPQPWVSVNVGPQGQQWQSCHLFWIAPCCPEAGKMGGIKRSSAPKDYYHQEFKCNSFSLTGKSISIQEVEG